MSYLKKVWLVIMLPVFGLAMKGQPRLFTHLDAFDGLSDNKLQYILQLDDGRMIFTTPRTINIYDGSRFRYFTLPEKKALTLPAYEGASHVYKGRDDLLWMKDRRMVACFDVRRERYVPDLKGLLQKLNGAKETVADLFLDSNRMMWLVRKDKRIWNANLKKLFTVPQGMGTLQDVDVSGNRVYFFFSSGRVACASIKTGGIEYVSSAYSPSEARLYDKMSLVVKAPDGCFYQLRNGKKAICLKFNPQNKRWQTLLITPYVLHTLIVPDKEHAYITCGKGLWKINPTGGRTSYKPSLQMVEGSSITTDINTVFEDRDGGWWLGTYDKGLLYGHVWRDAFLTNTGSKVVLPQKAFHPILINVAVDGKSVPVQADEKRALLPQSAPFVHHFEFGPKQNTLAFDFSALNYALPMKTCYRYALISGADSVGSSVIFSSQSKVPDEKGILHLPFSRLKPGFYRLQVSAMTPSVKYQVPVTEITFRIRAPWWQTSWACILYSVIVSALIVIGLLIYNKQKERKRKEQALLERIRTLVERCNRYETEKEERDKVDSEQETIPTLTPQDNEFLQKAIALVKEHLNGTYSVEELSRDLCMERTGLYKKLTALLDQSPSLFIRNIRLQQAAGLLMENKKSISDIALETGFSSASYFSKCFQKMYGCKPSEYIEKQEKST